MSAKTGLECFLYRNTGTDAIPVWDEIDEAKDVNSALSKEMADVSRRKSEWKMEKGALKEGSVEFGFQHTTGAQADWAAIIDSYLNGTPIQFAVMDEDIAVSGAWGFKAFCEVSEMPLDQPLSDGVTSSVVAKPTDHEESGSLVEPDFITT